MEEMMQPKIYGSMEGGGTKFICAVGTGPDDIREEIRFPTTTPD
jgi:fructokinase